MTDTAAPMATPDRASCIYHVCTRAQAAAALADGSYRAPSLALEGFIHLSQAHQVSGVVDRYYAGQTGLVLLVVAPQQLGAPLRYEPPANRPRPGTAPAPERGELFPHLYGPLNAEAVIEVVDLAAFLADVRSAD